MGSSESSGGGGVALAVERGVSPQAQRGGEADGAEPPEHALGLAQRRARPRGDRSAEEAGGERPERDRKEREPEVHPFLALGREATEILVEVSGVDHLADR